MDCTVHGVAESWTQQGDLLWYILGVVIALQVFQKMVALNHETSQ